jgi:phosphatidylserine/phosphatidylglycerophosphate/cardiolipin synthase-like enzyme
LAGGLPHRVIVEALVRLMRAGWLEMLQGAYGLTFRITRRGALAAQADNLPSATRRLSRRMNFVVEQVSGTVFRTRELPPLSKRVVQERSNQEIIVWLDRPMLPIHDPIQGTMDALLFEDETFVTSEQIGDRFVERWSLATVRDGVAEGLPRQATPALKDAVERAAKDAPSHPRQGVYAQPAPAPAMAAISAPPPRQFLFTGADLLLGGDAHRSILDGLLGRARHRVIIHSTFIDQERFTDLLPAFRTAIAKGARIDVLWGQDENAQGARATWAVVGRLQTVIADAKLDRLRLHPTSTGSHAKLLIADDGDPARLTAVVGSCNWLYSGFDSFEASLRMREPCLVADVLDQLAELSRGAKGAWLPLTSDLAAQAARQRARPQGPTGKAEARILLAGQHAETVRQAMDEAKARIFVTSHRWSHAGHNFTLAPLLTAAAASENVKVAAYYGQTSGTLTGGAAAAATAAAFGSGVTIRPIRKPRLHAKLLAWDDDHALITSQNLLSADPPDSRPRQEIGVLVRAVGIARTLVDRFEAARID